MSNNVVEGWATLWGIMIAREKGWNKLWIELDSKLIIDALKGNSLHNWRLEIIVKATKFLLKDFEEVKFSHMGTNGNRMVDSAANEGVSLFSKTGTNFKSSDKCLSSEFCHLLNEDRHQ
ncbi:hypothetical protein SUGI_0713800 [Cryptomeria japonica]|nr:hypothetical protein SUGI_0713800 [Cryptomeria japonica]